MADSGLQFLVQMMAVSTDQDTRSKYENLVLLYQNRLWHQFSQSLLVLVNGLTASESDAILSRQIYDAVIKDNMELRISQLMHTEIAYAVVSKYTSLPEARQFIERVKVVVDQRASRDQHAKSLVRIILAKIDLVAKEFDKAEELLEEVKNFINDNPPTSQVHGRYYDVASSLFQVRGDHTNFYHSALNGKDLELLEIYK